MGSTRATSDQHTLYYDQLAPRSAVQNAELEVRHDILGCAILQPLTSTDREIQATPSFETATSDSTPPAHHRLSILPPEIRRQILISLVIKDKEWPYVPSYVRCTFVSKQFACDIEDIVTKECKPTLVRQAQQLQATMAEVLHTDESSTEEYSDTFSLIQKSAEHILEEPPQDDEPRFARNRAANVVAYWIKSQILASSLASAEKPLMLHSLWAIVRPCLHQDKHERTRRALFFVLVHLSLIHI